MHSAQNYDHLIQECSGFLSEQQLRNHFTLYQGYVKKMNEIASLLDKADRSSANYSFGEYSELRRREPVAYNGTYLHELYFGNLGKKDQPLPTPLKEKIDTFFANKDSFFSDIKAIVASGHGWCLVTYDMISGKIRNQFVQGEHHVGLLSNQYVLLAIDGWEHAYFMDYGTKKADYVSSALLHINWSEVYARLSRVELIAKPAGV